VAFFAAGGVGGRRRVHASLSRSSRGVRSSMQADGNWLEFEMPLAPQGAAQDLEERHIEELRELGRVTLHSSAWKSPYIALKTASSTILSKPANCLFTCALCHHYALDHDWGS